MNECIKCPFCQDSTIAEASESAVMPAIVQEFGTTQFTVWRCSKCDSLHSKEAVDLDAIYRIYPYSKMENNFFTIRANQTRLEQLLKFHVKPSDSILDFGCGAGAFVNHLKSQGYDLTSGYDPFVAEFNQPGLLEKKYDVIVSQDVIEHADAPAVMVTSLVRMLKPGGLLCMGTPCADRIRLKPYQPFAVSLHQPYHRHIFSKKALIELTKNAGLIGAKIFNRHISESLVPGINLLFLHEFIRFSGGFLNAGFEPIKLGIFLRRPQLFFYLFFGYFFSRRSEMVIYCRAIVNS